MLPRMPVVDSVDQVKKIIFDLIATTTKANFMTIFLENVGLFQLPMHALELVPVPVGDYDGRPLDVIMLSEPVVEEAELQSNFIRSNLMFGGSTLCMVFANRLLHYQFEKREIVRDTLRAENTFVSSSSCSMHCCFLQDLVVRADLHDRVDGGTQTLLEAARLDERPVSAAQLVALLRVLGRLPQALVQGVGRPGLELA